MESSQESLFEQAMDRYQAGASAEEILPDFIRITEAAPRQSAGWTCLAWLQLLCNQPEEALRSARFAVKLNPQDPQARINLSLALLDTQSKGARSHPGGAAGSGYGTAGGGRSEGFARRWPEAPPGLGRPGQSQDLARAVSNIRR